MKAPRNEREAHAALSRTPAMPAEPMPDDDVTDVALVLASVAAANEREKMQMNEMTHPRCFNSRKEYDSWRESARMCGEYCSICDDCTPAYMHEMQLQDRCDRTIFCGFVPKKRLDDSRHRN